MSGEPRRSGRATKGQHTKNQESETPQSANKKRGKGKTKQTSEEPDEDAEDSIVRCVCGATEDNEGFMMISCEECETWQHNLCMEVTEDPKELEHVKYFCEQCKPQDHKKLLAAMSKGEEPWVQLKEERKPRKGKGGRKSAGAAPAASKASSAAAPSPPPTAEVTNKRKFDATQASNGTQQSPTRTVTHEPKSKRTKSISNKDESAAVKALYPLVEKIVNTAVKDGKYKIPNNSSVEIVGKRVAFDIDDALAIKYGSSSPGYTSQFRAILFNIKKNSSLITRVLYNTLSPEDLAEMSTDDMASEEVQKERAAVKEELDKQATLIQEEGPRYRKTHKGDELIADEPSKPTESAYVAPVVRRRTTEDSGNEGPVVDTGSPSENIELPEDYDRPQQAPTSAITPTSASFNIQNVFKSVKPSDPTKGVFMPRRSISISKQQSSEDVALQDADGTIDRLLSTEDEDGPNFKVWEGEIFMNGVGSFKAIARFGCGGDISKIIHYNEFLSNAIELNGRIAIDRINNYLSGLRNSTQHEVTGLIIKPNSDQDQSGFDSIFNYFKEKGRWAVHSRSPKEIESSNKAPVQQEFYFAPITDNSDLPSVLHHLLINSIPKDIESRLLLLLMVTPKAIITAQTGVPQSTASPIPAPHTPTINQTNPSFSPVPPSGTPSFPILGRATRPIEMAILGSELIKQPVAIQLLTAVREMSEVQLQNMRDIFLNFPETRHSLEKFSKHVAERERDSGKINNGIA